MISIKAMTGVRTHELTIGRLDCESSECCDPWGIHFDSFVPSSSPSIIMDINLILVDVDNLSFKPLVYCVFDINSLTKIKSPLSKIESWGILKIFSDVWQSLKVGDHVFFETMDRLKILPDHFQGH
jgi:hypothetical protein